MAQQTASVELIRDGQCTPWGFRLTGGADVGSPLVIQRVFLGSPSEGELRRGDVILKIRDFDAIKLTHKQAADLIAKAGNTMKLVVARSSGPVPISPPVSPAPFLASPGTPITMYHLSSAPSGGMMTSPPPPLITPPGSEHLFRPLPTTQFPEQQQRTYSTVYQVDDSTNEKVAINQQAYRTLPLITPKCKSSKDAPIGSYLRFTYDTSGGTGQLRRSSSSASQRVNDIYMLSKVQESVIEAASNSPRASVSPGRTPTPDMAMGSQNGPQLVHRQYNSPINIYSNQAVMEAIVAQTPAAKQEQPTMRDALKDVIVGATNVLSGNNPTGTLSPKPPADISKSPTYQLIHDEEWKNLNKGDLREHRPVENRVYNVIPLDEPGLNPFGISHEKIHQSGSFKTLMTSLQGVTEF